MAPEADGRHGDRVDREVDGKDDRTLWCGGDDRRGPPGPSDRTVRRSVTNPSLDSSLTRSAIVDRLRPVTVANCEREVGPERWT